METNLSELEKIGKLALQAAHKLHNDLGQSGEEMVSKNQFGDTAMRADIEAEQAVLGVLRQFNLPITVISEEHGTTNIGDNPTYLGILDGLDGSYLYKEQRGKGRYGTMFAIYANTDPQYNEYLFGGIIEHASNRLYFATKGNGSFVLENGVQTPIHVSGATQLSPSVSRIYADTYYDTVYKTDVITSKVKKLQSTGYSISCLRSSAIHYADLAQGNADAVIENTRKGNLEIAVSFPLVVEAGGKMVDINGTNLENQKYLTFGQDKNVPIISANSLQLANELCSVLQGS